MCTGAQTAYSGRNTAYNILLDPCFNSLDLFKLVVMEESISVLQNTLRTPEAQGTPTHCYKCNISNLKHLVSGSASTSDS